MPRRVLSTEDAGAFTIAAVIAAREIERFHAVLGRHGWRAEDFELQEDLFNPQKAELEAASGEIGVRCLVTQAVEVYRLGPGFDWLADFASDLERGRFGRVPP